MVKRVLCLVSVALVLDLSTAFAQDEESQSRKGDTELQFSGSIYYRPTTPEGVNDSGSLTANLRVGKFVSERSVLGLGITLSGPIDPTAGDNEAAADFVDSAQGELFWKMYTRTEGTFSPYFKANYFFPVKENQDDGWAALGFGLNNWIRPDVSVFWEVNYGSPVQDFGNTDAALVISLFGVGVSF